MVFQMTADRPFVFKACHLLLESTGIIAYDVAQLLEGLRAVPEESIYIHTYGSYLRHQFLPPPYPNDFASWAVEELRDFSLAEKLGIIDPLFFPSLKDLREAFIDIIYHHLQKLKQVPSVSVGEPFYFFSGHRHIVEIGCRAHSLREMIQHLRNVHISSIYYHTFDAMCRYRTKGGTLALWAENALNMPRLAEEIRSLPFYLFSLSSLRENLVQIFEKYA